jgi:hypothetical protein
MEQHYKLFRVGKVIANDKLIGFIENTQMFSITVK